MIFNFKIIKSILPKNYYSKYKILIFFFFIASLLELVSLGSILPLIETLLDTKNSFILRIIKSSFNNINLNSITFSVVFIFLFKTFYLVWLSFYRHKFMKKINNALSSKLSELFMNLSFISYQSLPSSKLIRNLNDVRLSVDYLKAILSLISELFIFNVFLIFLFFYNFKITLIILMLFAIASILYYLIITKRVQKWGEERKYFESVRIANLQKIFNSFVSIKLLSKENYFLEKFMNSNRLYEESVFKNKVVYDFPKLYFELIILIFILYIILTSNSINEKNIVLNLSIYLVALYKIVPSIIKLISNYQLISFNYPVVRNHLKLLKKDNFYAKNYKKKNIEYKKQKFNFNKLIEFKDVTFRYDNSKEILTKASLSIKKGEFICIKGESGSGKSSLIYLLAGLVKPASGQIKIDNLNLNKIMRYWQHNIAYISQNLILNNDTILENIAFGENKNSINKFKIKKILTKLKLKKFNNILNKKINERNLNISGGQTQRLGIARALYLNKDVIIFDESTSALDYESERKILKEIAKLKRKKTLIMINHRDLDFSFFDKIYKLHNGQIKQLNK